MKTELEHSSSRNFLAKCNGLCATLCLAIVQVYVSSFIKRVKTPHLNDSQIVLPVHCIFAVRECEWLSVFPFFSFFFSFSSIRFLSFEQISCTVLDVSWYVTLCYALKIIQLQPIPATTRPYYLFGWNHILYEKVSSFFSRTHIFGFAYEILYDLVMQVFSYFAELRIRIIISYFAIMKRCQINEAFFKFSMFIFFFSFL